MAERGRDTLRFGPMKPVGLTNPHAPQGKPYAVVQLRRDNALGTLYNLVGFQTKMKHGAQTEVFRMIPGLENARFARLGGIHRNTFLNSPRLLDGSMRLKARPAAALRRADHRRRGLRRERRDGPARRAARRGRAARDARSPRRPRPPRWARCSATSPAAPTPRTFQPMNVNFGLFPPLDAARGGRRGRRDRYQGYTDRAKADFAAWLAPLPVPA